MSTSAQEGLTLVGDIIDIEVCSDLSETEPTWDLVAKTQDTIELSPNVEIASARPHEKMQQDKAGTSEAWETSFTQQIVSGPGQLQTLGLLTEDFKQAGQYDSRDTTEVIRITVYADEAAKSAGEFKAQIGFENYLLAGDGGEIAVDDFSTESFVIHSRHRPLRLGLGATFTDEGAA